MHLAKTEELALRCCDGWRAADGVKNLCRAVLLAHTLPLQSGGIDMHVPGTSSACTHNLIFK